MVKRPLIIGALLYSAGLLLGNNFPMPLVWLFTVAFALLLVSIISHRIFFIWPLVVLAGWINFTWQTEILSPDDLRGQIGDRSEYVGLRGTLVETPRHRIFEMDEKESWLTLAQIDVTQVRKADQWQPASGEVIASTAGILNENFRAGQQIELTGILQSPRAPIAENLFDYKTYLRRQGIHFQLATAETNEWKVIGEQKAQPASNRFVLWAQKVLQRGSPTEDEPLRLTWAMTLGWKTALTDEVSEPFMRSGTMHIFAISGLHIALIAGILVSIFRVMQVPRSACGLIVIFLIWFYTGATGWQSSAVRSTVMMTIVLGGWSLKRPVNLLNSLAAAALIILLWNPLQIFQASFQLSFFVVLSIALLMPSFEKHRERLLNPDPLLPPELRSTWRKRLDWPLRYLTTSATTSLAAWLGSLPLVAFYFHLFTPVSLLANLLIVPLATGALMSNIGSLFFGNWFPFLTELFNHAGWGFMKAMVVSSEWFATRPGAFLYVPSPSIAACVLYYSLLFTVLSGWLFEPRKRVCVIVLVIGATLFSFWNWRAESRSVKLTVLPLSGGDAIFVDAPGRESDLLVDCGNSKAVQFVSEPFLRAQGVNSIANVLLTHGDSRHIGGFPEIENRFAIKKIFTSSVSAKSTTYREIVSNLKSRPDQWKVLNIDDRIGAWTVLHPLASDVFPQADDKALILRGNIHGKTILLLSDLGRPGQNALMERHDDLRADIVIAGLPAQGEPLSAALLEKIQPQIIVITDTEFPATERASRRLRERLSAQMAQVIYCRDSGAVTFVFDEQKCSVRSARDAKPFDLPPR